MVNPRQSGQNNKQRQEHQQQHQTKHHSNPESLQNQQQPLDQKRDYRHQLWINNATISMLKQIFNEGLPSGSNLALKPKRLEMQFKKEMFPLNESP